MSYPLVYSTTVGNTYYPFFDSAGNIWVGNYDPTYGGIKKLATDGTVLADITTTGITTSGGAEDQYGRLWFANFWGNTIDIVNPSTNTIVDTLTVGNDNDTTYGAGPYALCRVGKYMYCPMQHRGTDNTHPGYIRKYNSEDYSFVDIALPAFVSATSGGVSVSAAPHQICTDGTYVYVASELSSRVTKIRVSDNSIIWNTYCGVGNCLVVPVIDPVYNRIWVTGYSGDKTTIIDNVTGNVIYQMTVRFGCGIVFDGKHLWIVSDTDKRLYRYGLDGYMIDYVSLSSMSYLRGVAYNANTKTLVVGGSGKLAILDDTTGLAVHPITAKTTEIQVNIQTAQILVHVAIIILASKFEIGIDLGIPDFEVVKSANSIRAPTGELVTVNSFDSDQFKIYFV